MTTMSKSPMLTDAEQEVMDHIGAAMKGIQKLGLSCNETELAQAVHSLQIFVMVRVLNRIDPEYWGDWYE